MPLVRILVGMEAMGVGLDAQVYEAQRPPLEKRLTQLQVGNYCEDM
jgi:DNA polymerase I-like protein with 3'-5' exonuclease and polymerase domains